VTVLAVLSFIFQLGLAIHCIQSGRDKSWIYLILFVPMLGGLAYLITQVLPDIKGDPRARKAALGVARALDPTAELRRRKDELVISDNVKNRLSLADECMAAGLYPEAAELYESCLKGPDAEDPTIRLQLAQCLFAQDAFAQCREVLEAIVASHPDFRSTDGHLLYARTLQALDDLTADDEYEALLTSYPGEEARVRYAQWLCQRGDTERARALFEESLLRAKRAPKYYQRAQDEWLRLAKAELAR